jgi:hypothetical protein
VTFSKSADAGRPFTTSLQTERILEEVRPVRGRRPALNLPERR